MADPSGDMLFLNAATGEIIQAEENPDPDTWYRIVPNTSQAAAAFEDGEYPIVASMDEVNAGLTPEDWEQIRYTQYEIPGKLWQHAPDGQANWYINPRDGLYRAPAMRDPTNDWTVVPFDPQEESEEDTNRRRGPAKERLNAGATIEVPLDLYQRLAPGLESEVEQHRVDQYEQPWNVEEPGPYPVPRPPGLGSLVPEAPQASSQAPAGPSQLPRRQSLAAAAPSPSPSPPASAVPPGSGLRPIAPEVAARLQAILAQRRGPSATPAGPSVVPTETPSAV